MPLDGCAGRGGRPRDPLRWIQCATGIPGDAKSGLDSGGGGGKGRRKDGGGGGADGGVGGGKGRLRGRRW